MSSANSHQKKRINLSELKLQIAKQLGPDRSQMYFGCLNKLLAQKLSKSEFNKLCLLILGRENIALHNKLIRSILRNAYEAKSPPPVSEKSALNQTEVFLKKHLQLSDPLTSSPSLVHCNGDVLPPHCKRICIRKSPLGSNEKIAAYAQQSLTSSVEIAVKENGLLGPCDLNRPFHHHPSETAEHQAKTSMEGTEIFEESPGFKSSRKPLSAPLGVPFYPPSVGGARRSFHSASSSTYGGINCCNGELCHTEGLKQWMEKVAEPHGIGVTLDCANLLNNALDTYLKQLIKSTVELARVKSVQEPNKHHVFKQQASEKPFNGIWPGNQMHIQSSTKSLNANNGHRNQYTISLRDFQVAMELNPQQLGEGWPLLFEKMSIYSYEE